ncbi:MAG: DUF4238 domain-containing protein [Sideroxyarcus sp.]|nr:DUF4238 domain-containing protein [Sideroxyarcus sp.]
MSRIQNTPKSHHFVPESYLKRFTDSNGYLHIRDTARNQTRYQIPKKIMKIDAYYRQAWAPSGINPNILENGLASGIEDKIKSVIDCLIETPGNLTDEYAATLLVYMELQRIRVPRQAALAKDLMRETILRLAPADITTQINSSAFQLTMKDSARFDYMRMAIGSIHPWLARMEWEIIEAEAGSSFITTDSPVSFYNSACPPPAEPGVGLAGTIVFFPLSSRKLLLMRHPECRSAKPLTVLEKPTAQSSTVALSHGVVWDAAIVRNTNWKLARLAHELFVADNEATLRQGELS